MDIKEFMKGKALENIRVDYQVLSKEQIIAFELLNHAVLQLQGIVSYTLNFMDNFLTRVAPISIPEEMSKNIPKRYSIKNVKDVIDKINDFIHADDNFWRPVALIVNLLEYIIKVVKKIEKAFGKHHFVSHFMRMYGVFAEITVRNLVILLYNGSGDKLFSEASKLVNEEVMKHFKIDNDPENLLNIFMDLTALLVSLSEKTAVSGWEALKEEVFKYGGYIDGEKPTD